MHVLLEGIGCNCVNGEALRKMKAAEVQLEIYHLSNLGRANHRARRKLLVVDGRVGFTGSVGYRGRMGTVRRNHPASGALRIIPWRGRWLRRCRQRSSIPESSL